MTGIREISIAGRKIGPKHPPYIIAEISANHLQDFDRAVRILEVSAEAGADAVKLQTYSPDTITIDAHGPGFDIKGGLWDGRSLYELYASAYMPWDWHEPLIARGRELGVTVFSSPFDTTAVDLLSSLDVPAYKVASFECIDHPLVEYIASQGKPVIMSSGMADLAEIGEAVAVARRSGANGLALLHCVSGYPTPVADINLRTIYDLSDRYPDLVIGLSDHTMGTVAAVTAIALGAAVIEKHVTLARADGGPDAAFSLEPDELKELVQNCRTAWEALGSADYELAESEIGNVQFRRSLYAVQDIEKGAPFTEQNVRSIRPGFGLPPKRLPQVLGCHACRGIKRGEPLAENMIREWSPS